MSVMKSLGLDPKHYKHVHSDDKSTTLRHKAGHLVTIAHSAVSPKTQEMLKALSKVSQEDQTPEQTNEARDQNTASTPRSRPDTGYGKITAMRDGGKVNRYDDGGVVAPDASSYENVQAPTASASSGGQSSSGIAGGLGSAIGAGLGSAIGGGGGGIASLLPLLAAAAEGGSVTNGTISKMAGGGGVDEVIPDKGYGKIIIMKADESPAQQETPGPDTMTYSQGGMTQNNDPSAMPASMPNYAEGGPCINPNCSSQGQAHPNCKCYGGYAKGGKVISICDVEGKHEPDCKYYAEGGGTSAQGQMVRYGTTMDMKHAKAEAKGRMEHERLVKPKMQNLAEGGRPKAMYADKGTVDSDDANTQTYDSNSNQSTPDQVEDAFKKADETPEEKSVLDKIRDGYKEAITKSPATIQADMAQHMATQQSPQQVQQPVPPNQVSPPSSPQAPQQTAPQQIPYQQTPPVVTSQKQAAPMDPYEQTKQAAIQDMQNDKDAWGYDLKNGHISPKTYHDLFADKSTLGKIGTVFGMLLSGAGSGLAHQSNAVFDMMNTQIQNDLKAQEKSKDNAQNYLRLAQQHEMTRAQTNQLNADTALKSKTLANMYMNQAALHSLVQQANKLPTGSPEWQRAQQGLAMLSGQMDNEYLNLRDRAAIGQAQFNSFAGPQSSANSEEAFNQQQKARLLMGPKGQAMAQFSAGRHLPGWQGEATRDIPDDARNRINAMSTLDDKGKDVLNYVKAHTGTWNPQTRSVAQQKIEEMKNFYNDSIKGGALTQGRLGWYDEQFAKHPTDILAQLMGSTAKLNEMVNSNQHRRDLEVKYLGLDPNKRDTNQQSQPPIERLDPKSGRIILYDANTKQPLRYK